MYRWNQVFIASHKVFFIVFGIFGNVNLLYIIFSTPKLRSKSSLLQSVQSAAHIICIINSFLDIYLLLSDSKISRDLCYHYIFPVIFCFCVQATIMFCILLDLLLNLLFPIVLRNFKDWKYVVVMSACPCLHGAAVVFYGFQELDNKLLVLCNPPSALPRAVRRIAFHTIAVINTLSLLLFLILIFLFRKKSQKRNYCSKVMMHLKMSAAFFIVSTYFCTLAASFLIMLGYSGEDFYNMIGNLSITAMFAYSHTFYTIIWRSPEYRKRFISLYVWNPGTKVVTMAPSWIKNRCGPCEI